MPEFNSAFLLSSQVFSTRDTGVFGEYSTGFVERLGPNISPRSTKRPNILLIEDRDKFCDLSRDPRFHPEGLEEAFEAATAVLAILYRRPSQRERLGMERYTRLHEAAVDATLRGAGVAVFIKTTNDRLSYWPKVVRHFAPGATFRYTDSDGAALITAMAGSEA
ncbi:hypothetical protein GB927_016490 [Shinella sp. CPCC 100929]|uniref:Uncharacterized protein n=1 Tax=Shinella lacus TaxID=2654216 RepID=A0ABT1R904_9HYPH|nr:hypothetical protein [Shinella lacus]MCQ4631651.1 hypothetical protein [Shinella lacus]